MFPDMRTLCNDSSLSLKDKQGGEMYHIYSLYSESNHLSLFNQFSVSNSSVDICWALEFFMEIYIKFYDQLINNYTFPEDLKNSLNETKELLGVK